MVEAAHSARIRAVSFCCGFVLLAALGSGLSPSAAAPPDAEQGASVSIVNGSGAKIRDWPWQVALTVGGPGSRKVSARDRYFCTGSLIAHDLVITAAHCVADLSRSQIRSIEVISGRTWLGNRSGASAYVKYRLLAKNRNGREKYAGGANSPSWDVALLKLRRKLPGKPITLARSSQTGSTAPGRRVKTTGWGVTAGYRNTSSRRLRIATQVILPDAVCRRDNGRGYRPKTMLCLGGPAGNSSTCFGDSGGPLVVHLNTGWRIIGVTSFGDAYCDPVRPSVDTRVSGRAVRAWVRRTAIRVSGTDPLGAEGSAGPLPQWCRVPKLTGRTVPQARTTLKRAGCRLGRVKPDFYGYGRVGRTTASSLFQGWLTPIGSRIDLWVNR